MQGTLGILMIFAAVVSGFVMIQEFVPQRVSKRKYEKMKDMDAVAFSEPVSLDNGNLKVIRGTVNGQVPFLLQPSLFDVASHSLKGHQPVASIKVSNLDRQSLRYRRSDKMLFYRGMYIGPAEQLTPMSHTDAVIIDIRERLRRRHA